MGLATRYSSDFGCLRMERESERVWFFGRSSFLMKNRLISLSKALGVGPGIPDAAGSTALGLVIPEGTEIVPLLAFGSFFFEAI